VKRVLIDGWPTATVAEQLGISRATAYKWVRRYRADGMPGLEDRSSRPYRSPRRSSDEVTATILRARARRRYGPARLAPLLGHPRSTIYGVLRRAGLSRLRDTDRVTAAPIRYVACHPGALVHQDHKKLGRVPQGGGWRVLGREAAPHHGHSNAGYDHLEVFVDDASRYAVEQAIGQFAEVGVRIERMLTDNGASYRSHAYRDVLVRHEIRHKRTRPFRPQTNGKAERFIQTLLNEWAYARPYRSNGDRLYALRRFVAFYNRGRPHTAIAGLVPHAAVNNVLGHLRLSGPSMRSLAWRGDRHWSRWAESPAAPHRPPAFRVDDYPSGLLLTPWRARADEVERWDAARLRGTPAHPPRHYDRT